MLHLHLSFFNLLADNLPNPPANKNAPGSDGLTEAVGSVRFFAYLAIALGILVVALRAAFAHTGGGHEDTSLRGPIIEIFGLVVIFALITPAGFTVLNSIGAWVLGLFS